MAKVCNKNLQKSKIIFSKYIKADQKESNKNKKKLHNNLKYKRKKNGQKQSNRDFDQSLI